MAICSACESDFDVDEFDVDRGDQLSCPECGANLVVSALSPLELERADEPGADFVESEDGGDEDGDEDDWE
jgi:alpha-aminoadipate carrier protein LysW